jgi:hypothetical protein
MTTIPLEKIIVLSSIITNDVVILAILRLITARDLRNSYIVI